MNESLVNVSSAHPGGHESSHAHRIFFTTMNAILIILICSGNGLILILVAKYPRLRTSSPTNILIAAMAFHDLMIGLITIPMRIISIQVLKYLNEIQCLASNIPTYALHIVSSYTLLLLALDRFAAIIFPLRYIGMLTEMRVYLSLVIIWMYGIFIGCLPVLGWNTIVRTGGGNSSTHLSIHCHIEFYVDGHYLGFMYILNVIPCMVLQIVLYSKIVRTARKQARKIDAEAERCAAMATHYMAQKPDRRGLLVLAMTSLFFTLSYTPMILETAIDYDFYTKSTLDGPMWSNILYSVGHIMILTNAAINPLFYGFSTKDYQEKIWTMIKRRST